MPFDQDADLLLYLQLTVQHTSSTRVAHTKLADQLQVTRFLRGNESMSDKEVNNNKCTAAGQVEAVARSRAVTSGLHTYSLPLLFYSKLKLCISDQRHFACVDNNLCSQALVSPCTRWSAVVWITPKPLTWVCTPGCLRLLTQPAASPTA